MAFHMQMAHGSWLAQGFVHMSQPDDLGKPTLDKTELPNDHSH